MQSERVEVKKEYREPKLTVHGTLAQLTQTEEKDFRIRMLSESHQEVHQD